MTAEPCVRVFKTLQIAEINELYYRERARRVERQGTLYTVVTTVVALGLVWVPIPWIMTLLGENLDDLGPAGSWLAGKLLGAVVVTALGVTATWPFAGPRSRGIFTFWKWVSSLRCLRTPL